MKENWGKKRVCASCAVKFYDFSKNPILCPACGVLFDPEELIKRKTKFDRTKTSRDNQDEISIDEFVDIDVDAGEVADDDVIVALEDTDEVTDVEMDSTQTV